MRARPVALVAMVVVCAFGLSSCSTQARAERKGKAAGDEICKAKNANNANEAQRHINRANDKLNDLARFTGRDVREDVRDLDRNLNQMARGQRIGAGREHDHSERGRRPFIGTRQFRCGLRRDAGGTCQLRVGARVQVPDSYT